jgi:endonuclease G, mitochondrial
VTSDGVPGPGPRAVDPVDALREVPEAGYDVGFLGPPVPLPTPPTTVPTVTLPATHFTVLLDPARRLAVSTGVNLDGARLVELERGDDWHRDDRVAPDQQAGPEVYADNDLDRGHLVRRRDPVWGDPATAQQANRETFSYPNAAPQAALFNQGRLLWAGLEDYVLTHARTYGERLSVLTAPIFAADDPPYRGIAIPRRFFKIVAWAIAEGRAAPTLAATGYVLDQSPQLDLIDLSDGARLDAGPPPLGAYLTYQVPIADIATLTGLDLGPLPAADRLPPPVPVPAERLGRAVDLSSRWHRVERGADLRLVPPP